LSGGFSVGGVDFADGVAGFAAAGFPTVKYLRIFSRRFSPSPREQIVNALERAIRFAHLQNLVRRRQPDSRAPAAVLPTWLY
jgi:hypothetical protein